MKFACTIGILIFTAALHAQDITGIWRGYFYSGYGVYKQQFKYEIQINQLNGKSGPGNAKAIKGVTYSYRVASFYGKAHFIGIYSSESKNITLKEDTLEDVKMESPGFSCLMTCYLEYHKMGGQEVLEGTFSSVVTNKGNNCGDGSVYLERVEESDFHKEDFLLKKIPDLAKPTPSIVGNTAPAHVKRDTSAVVKKPRPVTPPTQHPVVKQSPPKKPATVSPSAGTASAVKRHRDSLAAVAKNNQKAIEDSTTIVKTAPTAPPVITMPSTENVTKKTLPVPGVIKERENPLFKTIVTNSPDIKIDLYDNGIVDGDTITVYDNNELLAFKRGLSEKPITLHVTASATDPHHEFVMVADNLGSIPPNTALMVVTTGGKRYEVNISSDMQKNAKVVIDYKAPGNGQINK